MDKEYYKIENKEFTISFTNNEIEALRKKQSIRKSVRIFDDTIIGLSGTQSDIDFDILEKSAIETLKMKILVNYNIPDGRKKEWNIIERKFKEEEILSFSEQLLNKLKKELPEFIFSGKNVYNEKTFNLKNTLNADYSIKKNGIDFSLLFKHKDSVNIIDGFWGKTFYNDVNLDEFVLKLKLFLDRFNNFVNIQEKQLPIVFLEYTMAMPFRFIVKHINGERYGLNASYFNEKINEKIFSNQFSLYDLNYNEKHHICSPIDGDGFEREIEQIPIFENGEFKTALYDIRRARQYCKIPTGTSSRNYNGNTEITPNYLYVPSNNVGINNIEKCIVILVYSGGDFQDNGQISIPVQLAFLMEYGEIKGRIKECVLTNHIDNMFNKDYIGALKDGLFENSIEKYMVFNMNIQFN